MRVRELVRDVRSLWSLAAGGFEYRRTGRTPPRAYLDLIRLFCRTNGYANEWLHFAVKRRHPPASFPSTSGVLGELAAGSIEAMADRLREVGYYVFPQKLDDDACGALFDLASRSEARLSPRPPAGPERAIYDRSRPLATTYRFDRQILADNRLVKTLLADCSLLGVAQAYLGCEPIIDSVGMWWSTPADRSDESRSQAAQLFHFDMDRIKWLKFFFYLTDVTPETGPHCYVPKSHRAGSMPRELRRRGYARISDEEIRRHFGTPGWVEITGPRGTIVAVDTRGYHKGRPLESGERLVFELELSDCLFGGETSAPHLDVSDAPELAEMARRFPRVYSWFESSPAQAHEPFRKAA